MPDDTPNDRLHRELAREDSCPKCLGELDTGWECNDCGFDAMPLVPPAPGDRPAPPRTGR
jgi:hypothetical protein